MLLFIYLMFCRWITTSHQIETKCPGSDWINYAGNCYNLQQTTTKTWQEAQTFCSHVNANLVSLTSQEEIDFLNKQGLTDVWIGLFKTGTNGRWKWVDKSNVNLMPWDVGQPNNIGEDCGVAKSFDKLHDYPCTHLKSFVCKRAAITTTLDQSTPSIQEGFTVKIPSGENVIPDAVCSRSNWRQSLDRQGQSMCNDGNDFISGFYRNNRGTWNHDPLHFLEEAECCTRKWPWSNSKTQTVYADWMLTLDSPNSWAYCPAGYFLNGIYRSENTPGLLRNIEEGRCSKPADHPPYHGHCYNHDITLCFDHKGLCRCNKNYYVAGIYRGDCDQLCCIEALRCCKTASAPEELDELYKVKTHIMDTTMSDMALLANYLGYGWCLGCRAEYVGEDFRRSGDTWHADKSGRCEGYMSDKRLSMAYGDWSFGIKDIKYGTPVIQDLTPETIDSGTIYNNDTTEATKTIERSETSVRSVTHTTTSSWKYSHELNVQVSYMPFGLGVSAGYKFNYETSTTTSDETKKEQSKTFSVSTSKTLKPNSASKWSLVLSKTRTSVTYTATVIAKFSTELQGFLRWGQGPSGIHTNYHYQHRGSGDRPTFNYRFGDSRIPFYTALKRQSETNSQPWLWNDMKNAYPDAQSTINDLCNENRYVFKITGRFDDVSGKHAEFHWDSVPLRKRSADRGEKVPDVIHQNSTHVAKALPNDVPLVKLEPPKVNIEVKNQAKIVKLAPSGS